MWIHIASRLVQVTKDYLPSPPVGVDDGVLLAGDPMVADVVCRACFDLDCLPLALVVCHPFHCIALVSRSTCVIAMGRGCHGGARVGRVAEGRDYDD